MKKFVKDYWNLQKESMKFLGNHPIGCIVVTVASGAISLAPAVVPVIKQKIKDKKTKIEGDED